MIIELMKYMFPFITNTLKDTRIKSSGEEFLIVRQSTKFMNKAKYKKSSFIDTLSGFLNKESSSEDEDGIVKFSKNSSVSSPEIENVFSKGNFSIFNDLISSATYLDNKQVSKIIREFQAEIFIEKISAQNIERLGFLLYLMYELYSTKSELFIEDWQIIISFVSKGFTEDYENELKLITDESFNEAKIHNNQKK